MADNIPLAPTVPITEAIPFVWECPVRHDAPRCNGWPDEDDTTIDSTDTDSVPDLYQKPGSVSSSSSDGSMPDLVSEDSSSGGSIPDLAVYDMWLADDEDDPELEGPMVDWTPANEDIILGEQANSLMEVSSNATDQWKIGFNTYLADSGASSHMGPGDSGMFDLVQKKPCSIKVGDGNILEITKVGKRKGVLVQADGTETEIVLDRYKCVKGLWVNLFSLTAALASGWSLGNKGKILTLTKGRVNIQFDHLIDSGEGYVCGLDIIPKTDHATPTLEAGTKTDINTLHQIFNHTAEETVKLTAAEHSLQAEGKLKPCFACKTSNARKKDVAKQTKVIATKLGERLYIDSSSMQLKGKSAHTYWVMAVDDKTNQSWSFFVPHKDEQVDPLYELLLKLKKNGTPCKYIRCDNAGENKLLKEAVDNSPDLDIEFEFTPRDSPQYNGRVERKFAFLYNGVRAALNAAKLPAKLRDALWPAAARYTELVANCLVTPKNKEKGSSYKQFHGKTWAPFANLRPFGVIGVVTTKSSIQGKDKDKGTPMIYVGPASYHALDVHRFWNPETRKYIESRDIQWMDQYYGDWKGLKDPEDLDQITHLPVDYGEDDEPEDEAAVEQPVAVQQQPNQQQPPVQEPAEEEPVAEPRHRPATPVRVARAMRQLETSYNPDASQVLQQAEVRAHTRSMGPVDNHPAGREREQGQSGLDWSDFASFDTLACLTMLDRLQLSPDELALAATDKPTNNELLKPEDYRDAFTAPTKYEEAWNHPDPFQRKSWREAIHKEFSKMNERKVWRKVKRSDIPSGRRLVKCKWVFDIKRNGVFRARLVACGYSQVGGIDFNQVFSPVVHDVTFRIMLLAKMIWKLDSYLFDVETAFLLGNLEEEIYMECPPGLTAFTDECLLLQKTIYGLVQSARQFYKLWAKTMSEKLGFKASPADPCLFSRGSGTNLLIVCLYVDDGYCIGKEANILKFFEEIRACGLKITTEKSMGDYLSCEVHFNKDHTKAWLGQPHMIKKLEKTFADEVSSLTIYKTPGTPGYTLIRPQNDEEKTTPELQTRYRSGTGMLLYLVKHSRPDISNAVRELTKVMDGATKAAYKEMLRLVKYVLDTKHLGLKLEPTLLEGDLVWNLIVYTDSDWAGDKENRKSISGFIMFLCGVPIMWRSKQQGSVALSSAEAEYIAISEAAKEIMFVLFVLKSLGIQVKSPVTVHVDNMGAIFMSENSSSGGRTRHIDTRYHFVRELVEDKVLEVIFVKSAENKADGFTKNLTVELGDKHNKSMVWNKSEVGCAARDWSPVGRVLKGYSHDTGTQSELGPNRDKESHYKSHYNSHREF